MKELKSKKAICLMKNCINFTFGKVYEAKPMAIQGLGDAKQPADFRVEDDEGDYFIVASTVDELRKNWQWVENAHFEGLEEND